MRDLHQWFCAPAGLLAARHLRQIRYDDPARRIVYLYLYFLKFGRVASHNVNRSLHLEFLPHFLLKDRILLTAYRIDSKILSLVHLPFIYIENRMGAGLVFPYATKLSYRSEFHFGPRIQTMATRAGLASFSTTSFMVLKGVGVFLQSPSNACS